MICIAFEEQWKHMYLVLSIDNVSSSAVLSMAEDSIVLREL